MRAEFAVLPFLILGLGAGASAAPGGATAPGGTRDVRVSKVEAVDLLRLDDGSSLRLSGVGEPSSALHDEKSLEPVRRKLEAELTGKVLRLEPDAPRPLDRKEARGEVWDAGASVNERLLARGDGRLDLARGPSAGDARFLAAAKTAAAPRSRRESIPLGFQSGIVLPLYSKDARHDYGPRVREIAATGATWVSFLVVWMVDRMEGHRVAPRWKQPYWEDNRTVPDEDLVAAIRTAKECGLRVLLLPVCLPLNPGPDDWRGNLRPADRDAFFESYARFVFRHADLAEELGVDALSIGSELISLESRQSGDVEWWRRIARSARQRFGGRLTYSANWDHYEEVAVWEELDFVGMTAYYSLTSDPKAEVPALVEAWKPVQAELRKFSERVRRPIVFTEVGYASLEGINTDPWNYKMETPLDLAVQDRCYKAFAKAFESPDFLCGAYFFDWYDEGGPKDKSYSPRGKPAEKTMRGFLAAAAKFAPPRFDPARQAGG